MINRGYNADDLRGEYSIVQTSAPTAEPVSLAMAKAHLRVDFTDDDALITAYITAARQLIEDWCGICLVRQSWAYSFQQWYRWEIRIPRGFPLRSVDSIQYYDVNDALQTVDTSVYQVVTASRPGRIRAVWNQVWPSVWYRMDAITVNHTSGYLLPTVADDTADTLTIPAHGLANGAIVRVYNTDNAFPGGLAAATAYYVVNATTDALQLSATSGGSAIDITSAGTGQTFLYQEQTPEALMAAIKLLIGHLYENRQEVVVETGRATVQQIPLGVQSLIAPYRDYGL